MGYMACSLVCRLLLQQQQPVLFLNLLCCPAFSGDLITLIKVVCPGVEGHRLLFR